jgi:hypothetical protein
MNDPGSKEEYRAQQSELMRAKTPLILAQTELTKAKTERIRLQNGEYDSSASAHPSLQEKIDRLRSQTHKLVDRYGLESDDLDDDEEELESFESKKPVRRLLKRSPK